MGGRAQTDREQSMVSQAKQSQCSEGTGRQDSVSSRLGWHVPDHLGYLDSVSNQKQKQRTTKRSNASDLHELFLVDSEVSH